MSFVNSVGLWLVTIILKPSAKKTSLDIRYSVWNAIYVFKKKKKAAIERWGTPCLTNPHPEEVVLEYLLSTRTLLSII